MTARTDAQKDHVQLLSNSEATLRSTDPQPVEFLDGWAFGDMLADQTEAFAPA